LCDFAALMRREIIAHVTFRTLWLLIAHINFADFDILWGDCWSAKLVISHLDFNQRVFSTAYFTWYSYSPLGHADMSNLIHLGARRAKPLQAPYWVAKAMDGAQQIGQGSYAKVYSCHDGSTLKITRDKATMMLASRLAKQPFPGFCPVFRASTMQNTRTPTMAFSMPKLTRLNAWQRQSISKTYAMALLNTCRLHGFTGKSAATARIFATSYACSSPLPCCEFSAVLCLQMAVQCRATEQGTALRQALCQLAWFCETYQCDIDLMGMDNWMLDDTGRLTLTDPVVHKAYAF